jgi:hypothetical protein
LHVAVRGNEQLACFGHESNCPVQLLDFFGLGFDAQLGLDVIVLLVEFEDVLLIHLYRLIEIPADAAKELQVVAIVDGLIVPDQVDEIVYEVYRL